MRASLKEYQAVELAALKRLKGVMNGDSTIAKDAFSEEAMVYGCSGAQFTCGPIQNFFNDVDRVGSHPRFEARVDVITLEETMAVVRVLEEKWGGNADFTDYLLMMKLNGEWKCVVQVYNQSSNTLPYQS
ncbi:MAG: nuclear transport factor 2 family protein [Lawsonibacter sp.]|nr:nuclear transport factor 2 family protein [Lawsonibacter sp.]